MITRHLTVYEHFRIPVRAAPSHDALSDKEAALLAQVAEARPGLCIRGHHTLTFGSWCGVVALEDRALEILPKVDGGAPEATNRALLINMLHKAGALPATQVAVTGQHTVTMPLLEVFIAAFFESILKIARGGLLRRYEREADDLRVVRGRIVAQRQFARLANRTDLISCEFDDLTPDNIWNQSLKAAIRAVRPWIVSAALSRQWIELMGLFADISDSPTAARVLPRLTFDRQAERYRTAIVWALWILSELSPDLRAGDRAAPALLFDMNRVFQAAVAMELARQSPDELTVATQDHRHWLGTIVSGLDESYPVVQLIPDIVVRRGREVVVIADTKWKLLRVKDGVAEIPPADVYQLLAYAVGYECNEIVLIAPKHAAAPDSFPNSMRLKASGTLSPQLRVVFVDVTKLHWEMNALIAAARRESERRQSYGLPPTST